MHTLRLYLFCFVQQIEETREHYGALGGGYLMRFFYSKPKRDRSLGLHLNKALTISRKEIEKCTIEISSNFFRSPPVSSKSLCTNSINESPYCGVNCVAKLRHLKNLIGFLRFDLTSQLTHSRHIL